MKSKLLPIGSVISMEESKKKLMVIGITQQNQTNGTVYDYIGVPYPEGFIDNETMFLFYHKDIKQVHFLGFVDVEFQEFRFRLSKKDDKED
jgi:hypothetical protein